MISSKAIQDNDVRAVLTVLKKKMKDLMWHAASYGEFVNTIFRDIAEVEEEFTQLKAEK